MWLDTSDIEILEASCSWNRPYHPTEAPLTAFSSFQYVSFPLDNYACQFVRAASLGSFLWSLCSQLSPLITPQIPVSIIVASHHECAHQGKKYGTNRGSFKILSNTENCSMCKLLTTCGYLTFNNRNEIKLEINFLDFSSHISRAHELHVACEPQMAQI